MTIKLEEQAQASKLGELLTGIDDPNIRRVEISQRANGEIVLTSLNHSQKIVEIIYVHADGSLGHADLSDEEEHA